MNLQVLGCAGGIGGRERLTTCMLVDDDILLDAGTGLTSLDLDALARIEHVFLTHAHLDHVAGLAMLADATQGRRSAPLTVHGSAEVIAVLKTHLFNWQLWPDFGAIPNEQAPVLVWDILPPGASLTLGSRTIATEPTSHTPGSMAYLVSEAGKGFAFTGDMCSTPALWPALAAQSGLRHVIVDCSFSNAEAGLAALSMHFCPATLQADVANAPADMQFLIYHLKPGQEDLIMQELQAGSAGRTYRALACGDTFRF